MKISALPTATTPLSGAELFPLVQSGNTRRVTLNDLLRSIGNGTAAAPALAPGGDPNTGIYFPAADTIGFVEGGVEVMRVDASGNLGIGTNSPAVRLHVLGGSSTAVIASSDATQVLAGFRYNTTTDVGFIGNGAAVFPGFSAGAFAVRSQGALLLGSGGSNMRWQIDASGHFLAFPDNSLDIGASLASRPRNIFIGNIATIATRIIVGSTALSATSAYGTPQIGTTSDAFASAHIESHNDASGNYSFLGLVRSRGTRAAPTHVIANDPIGVMTAQVVQDTATSTYRESASISFEADANHSSTSLPGRIAFRTTPVNATASTERMRLDASGNLGLGVTPSATTGGYINSQVGGAVLMGKASTAEAYLNNNATFNSGWKYIYNGPAVRYEQVSGHAWHIAPSGTAGNAITFTQAMTLDASGNLGVGVSSPSVRLHVDSGSADEAVRVNGTGSPFLAVNLSSVRQVYLQAAASFVNFWVEANKPLRFATNDVGRWQISATGHFIGNVDNTYDIGASGATRPRTVYAATSVEGGYIRAGAASAGAASTTTIGNGTATTVGAAGAASALPANPLGYIIAHVGTTQVKIPYYNN